MNIRDESEDILASLVKLIDKLHWYEPNGYTARIMAAKTAAQWYEVIMKLNYAANSKELRDGGIEEVHVLCEQIKRQVVRVDRVLHANLLAASAAQKAQWLQSVSRAPSGKYAFRNDGTIEISLLDAELNGTQLYVIRIWTHVCSVGGSWTDFTLTVNAEQADEIRSKLEDAAVFASVVEDWIRQRGDQH